jgi:hypothetical protein
MKLHRCGACALTLSLATLAGCGDGAGNSAHGSAGAGAGPVSGGSPAAAGAGPGASGSATTGGNGGPSAGASAAGGNAGGNGMSGSAGAATAGASGSAGAGGGSGGASTGPLIWPNEQSSKNGDTWLREHHDQLTELRPRVLLVNFDPTSTFQKVQDKAKAIAAAIAFGSKYHGYAKPDAPAFVNYQIAHAVDLQGQATRSGGGFGYGEFMTDQAFADKVGFKAPGGAKNLTVCEMFEQGFINEVWVGEQNDDSAKLYEGLARAQVYDDQLQPKAGQFDNCAGNGCVNGFTCGVTVRLGEINPTRGPGCGLHAYGHAFEGAVKRNQIPYLRKNASRFLQLDLKTRYGAPFDDFYVCPYNTAVCIDFQSSTHLVNGPALSGKPFDIQNYGAGCGNVHFAPHSRYQYDYEGPASNSGRATCEGYGLGGGTDGADVSVDISYATYKAYNQNSAYNDCGGGWQEYMRQSFPGYGNQAKDVDGAPMKNWWPFMFY